MCKQSGVHSLRHALGIEQIPADVALYVEDRFDENVVGLFGIKNVVRLVAIAPPALFDFEGCGADAGKIHQQIKT